MLLNVMLNLTILDWFETTLKNLFGHLRYCTFPFPLDLSLLCMQVNCSTGEKLPYLVIYFSEGIWEIFAKDCRIRKLLNSHYKICVTCYFGIICSVFLSHTLPRIVFEFQLVWLFFKCLIFIKTSILYTRLFNSSLQVSMLLEHFLDSIFFMVLCLFIMILWCWGWNSGPLDKALF